MISLYDHLSFFLLGLAPSFVMVYSAHAWVYTCGVTLKEEKETAHSLYIQTLTKLQRLR